MPDDWLAPADLRGKVDSPVFEAVKWLHDEKRWKIRKQGHGYRVYCPCKHEEGGTSAAVPGTSGRPESAARRLRRNAEHCPDGHDLVK